MWGGGKVLWVFFSFRIFFSDNTRVRIFFFYMSRKARNLFPEFNIRLYDKNSESDFFFPPLISEYFFRKNIAPHLEVKWSVPNRTSRDLDFFCWSSANSSCCVYFVDLSWKQFITYDISKNPFHKLQYDNMTIWPFLN